MTERGFAFEYRHYTDPSRTYFQRYQKMKNEAQLFEEFRNPDLVMVHLEAVQEEVANSDEKTYRGPLLFDIDVTDYKDLLTCSCAESRKACSKCWSFVRLSMFIIGSMLEISYGVPMSYQKWFFSGNRGVHGHIVAARMFDFTAAHRAAVLDHLGNNKHIWQPFWHEIFPAVKKFFHEAILPDHDSAIDRYFRKRDRKPDEAAIVYTDQQITEVCMPRVDRAVTADVKHLIRMPFTVHKTSRRVARPVGASSRHQLLEYVPDHLKPVVPVSPAPMMEE